MAFTSGDGSETDNQSDNSFLIVEFNEKKEFIHQCVQIKCRTFTEGKYVNSTESNYVNNGRILFNSLSTNVYNFKRLYY